MIKKIIFVMFFAVALSSFTPLHSSRLDSLVCWSVTGFAYCQESEADSQIQVQRVLGQVAGLDWVGGKVVVRTFDYGNVDEMTFIVSASTVITKRMGTIPFADLNIGDPVAVEYCCNSFAGLKALSIAVQQ